MSIISVTPNTHSYLVSQKLFAINISLKSTHNCLHYPPTHRQTQTDTETISIA